MLILTFLKLPSLNLQLVHLIFPSPAPKGRNPNAAHNVMNIVSIIKRKGRGLRAHPTVNPNRRARLILRQPLSIGEKEQDAALPDGRALVEGQLDIDELL